MHVNPLDQELIFMYIITNGFDRVNPVKKVRIATPVFFDSLGAGLSQDVSNSVMILPSSGISYESQTLKGTGYETVLIAIVTQGISMLLNQIWYVELEILNMEPPTHFYSEFSNNLNALPYNLQIVSLTKVKAREFYTLFYVQV